MAVTLVTLICIEDRESVLKPEYGGVAIIGHLVKLAERLPVVGVERIDEMNRNLPFGHMKLVTTNGFFC